MKKILVSSVLLFTGIYVLTGCSRNFPQDHSVIIDTILTDENSYFYLDTEHYPQERENLPIGVFDSGTGGLTVLEQIITFDEFDNASLQHTGRGDGRADFSSEHFIYLGDQANMPYGSYSQENNLPLLREHILKDAQFLLGTR